MLWKAFGDHEQYPYFDEDFIQQIDDHDNGGKECEINKIIRAFNRTSHESSSFPEDTAFQDAANMAMNILERLFVQYDEDNLTRKQLEECEIKENCDGLKYIISPVPPRNNRYLYEKDIRIIIYPHLRGGYAVQFRSDKFGSMESSYAFPSIWNGKSEEYLPDGVTFIHKSGFLANCKDLETAEKMVNYKNILKKYHNELIMDCLNEFGKFIYDKYTNMTSPITTIKISSETGRKYELKFWIDNCLTINLITNEINNDFINIDKIIIEAHHYNEILLVMTKTDGYAVIDIDGNIKRIL